MSDERRKLDINDPSIALPDDEQLEVSGELGEFPPPPPEADYIAKLTVGSRGVYEDHTRPEKGSKPYIGVHIEARIVAPGSPVDNTPVHDDVNTITFARRDGSRTNTMAIAYAAVTNGQFAIRTSELAKAFSTALRGEPQARIRIQWRGYCSACEEDVFKGRRSFPDGSAVAKCPKCGGEVAAQGRISRYWRLETAKAGNTAAGTGL